LVYFHSIVKSKIRRPAITVCMSKLISFLKAMLKHYTPGNLLPQIGRLFSTSNAIVIG
jgi:hypothetical protein